MQKLNKAPPLYENYKEHPPIKTIGQAEERINELQDHIERLEADGELEFFCRLASLEKKVDALEKLVSKR